MNRSILLAFFTLILGTFATAQVTSSASSGRVLSVKNESLIGAAVTITHEPTGTIFKALTDENGYFQLENMIVGGPYSIKTTYIGYKENAKTDVFPSRCTRFPASRRKPRVDRLGDRRPGSDCSSQWPIRQPAITDNFAIQDAFVFIPFRFRCHLCSICSLHPPSAGWLKLTGRLMKSLSITPTASEKPQRPRSI